MIRILQILSSLEGGGGVQTVLKNYYTYMNKDEFRFDFIVHGGKIGELEKWFQSYGSEIFHVTPRSVNPIKNVREIASVIKRGNYDVVHCHQDYHGAIAMWLSKRYGVKIRIIHSHRAYPPEKLHQKFVRIIETKIVKKTATHFMACGILAGEWLYGKKAVAENKVIVLNNATELDKFVYSKEKRDKIRGLYSLDENAVVLGHVGRFTEQKNHDLLINIFYGYLKECPNAYLMLVGDGALRKSIEKKVNNLGIEKNVLFLGVRNDVPDLLNAMDVFVLPSRYEGLGIVTIESQANGLPVICSGFVPHDVAISDNVLFVEKGKYTDILRWVSAIDKALEKGRTNNIDALRKAGYDIAIEAKKLEEIYRGD